MNTLQRHRIPTCIGASCLAAALSFSTGATIATAAHQAPAIAAQDDSGSDQSGTDTSGSDTSQQDGSHPQGSDTSQQDGSHPQGSDTSQQDGSHPQGTDTSNPRTDTSNQQDTDTGGGQPGKTDKCHGLGGHWVNGSYICNVRLGGNHPSDQNSNPSGSSHRKRTGNRDGGLLNVPRVPGSAVNVLYDAARCRPSPTPFNPYCWKYVAGVGLLFILPPPVESR
ncbi:hypothetical protein ACFYZ4_11305 [Streptomyces sp. NPDC001513]|uniref:hypothetical protein n=1 Tax=Streptomyces sp. NPDC001513 TaxID=3364580 RepID=UPI0036BAD2C1